MLGNFSWAPIYKFLKAPRSTKLQKEKYIKFGLLKINLEALAQNH